MNENNENNEYYEYNDWEELEKSNRRLKRRHIGLGIFYGVVLTVLAQFFIINPVINVTLWGNAISPAAKLREIINVIENHSIRSHNLETMLNNMYMGFISGVEDEYGYYFSANEFERFLERSEGHYAGVGVEVVHDQDFDAPRVVNVFSSTPAYEAGILPGDVFVAVNGVESRGRLYEEVTSDVRGEIGTLVTISVLRDDVLNDIELIRRRVQIPSVEYHIIENKNVGYIRIQRFDAGTTAQFQNALIELSETSALIIDLRNNPGGMLSTVVDVTSLLIDEGTVLYSLNAGGENRFYETTRNRIVNVPLAVLVNRNSASGSEVLAGAVMDAGTGIIIGETTFGKGTVQSMFTLRDQSGLRLTVAEYFTPSGRVIDGVGLSPDIYVELSAEEAFAAYRNEEDVALLKALEVLELKVLESDY